jgi:hypothetical protein
MMVRKLHFIAHYLKLPLMDGSMTFKQSCFQMEDDKKTYYNLKQKMGYIILHIP